MKVISLRLDNKVYEGLVATKPSALSMNAHIGFLLERACVETMDGALEMARVSRDRYAGMNSVVAPFSRGDKSHWERDEFSQQ
jgi:hypothetical protein